MLRRLLLFEFVPEHEDLGLLALRLIVSISIFVKHGYEKLFTYSAMYAWLARSGHYVKILGPGPSLMFATFADGVVTILLLFGVGTRWCALLLLVNLLGAWIALGFPYFGHQKGTDGELILSYAASLIALLFTGAGRYSVDWLLKRRIERP